jgi:hypothetical protein
LIGRLPNVDDERSFVVFDDARSGRDWPCHAIAVITPSAHPIAAEAVAKGVGLEAHLGVLRGVIGHEHIGISFHASQTGCTELGLDRRDDLLV